MGRESVERWLLGLCVLTAALSFAFVLRLMSERRTQKVLRVYREWTGFLSRKSKESSWYVKTEKWLLKKGAAFHLGSRIDPAGYLALCLILALCGCMIGMRLGVWYGLGMAVAFYLLPGWLIRYMNLRDNERLIPELKLLYHGLEIQIRAGVYVTDALTEMYAGVQDIRLQKALLDLAGAIAVKADVYDALEQFKQSFDNRYIDALCITLLQALESGQAVELLGDIAEQVKDMEVTVMMRQKGSLDRSVTFYQLGILAAMLTVVLYACIQQMFSVAVSF